MKTEELEKEFLKDIEKEFLRVRGWKNWEEYDRVSESSQGDINCRNELLELAVSLTAQKKDAEISEHIEEIRIKNEQIEALEGNISNFLNALKEKFNNWWDKCAKESEELIMKPYVKFQSFNDVMNFLGEFPEEIDTLAKEHNLISNKSEDKV